MKTIKLLLKVSAFCFSAAIVLFIIVYMIKYICIVAGVK